MFGMEREDQLLRDVNGKEGRAFPFYVRVLFCYPQISQTFFVEGSSTSMYVSPCIHAFLYVALFLVPG